MVWDYTAVAVTENVPRNPSVDFFYSICTAAKGINSAHIMTVNHDMKWDRYPTFLWAIKKFYDKSMNSTMFGYHRLKVLQKWRENLENFEPRSADAYVKYADLEWSFDDWDEKEVRKQLCFQLGEDIRRETEWQARVLEYGGVTEAIPQDLDEEFIKKVMHRKHLEEDMLCDPDPDVHNHFDYYEAFQRIVNEEYSGGGLHGASRVTCLRAWRDTLDNIECSDEPEEPFENDTDEARGKITWGCEQALQEEWAKQYGLKKVVPPNQWSKRTNHLMG